MPIDHLVKDLQNAVCKYAFDREKWARHWEKYASAVRRFFVDAASVRPAPRLDDMGLVEAEVRDTYTLSHVVVNSSRCAIPMIVLEPFDPNGAGVLCLHGHNNAAHRLVCGLHDPTKTGTNDFGVQFARRGYTVIAPCMVPFGIRGGGRSDRCGPVSVQYGMMGRSLAAENLRDVVVAFGILKQLPGLKDGRFGIAGFSLGANVALFAAAVINEVYHPNVEAIGLADPIPSIRDAAIANEKWDCGVLAFPGLLNHCDVLDVAASLAHIPMALEMTGCTRGEWPENSGRFRDGLQSAYETRGNHVNFVSRGYDGGHSWRGDAIFELFERVLGNGR